jgi:uncharacterized protein YjcR
MEGKLSMFLAPRCHAKSKRSGLQCQSPAVRGRSVCRMHGAAAGAPQGNQNALGHGRYSAEHIAERRQFSEILGEMRKIARNFHRD